jgi:hypothetical protein
MGRVMSVAVLVTGTLFKEPQQRIGKTGKPYVTTTIKAAGADNASSDFWSLLAFGDTAGAELLRLAVGERVAVQGSMKLELFEKNGETRISRTIFCDHAMALRQPPKERRAKAAKAPTAQETTSATSHPDLDDSIPFLMEWRG